MTNSPSGDFKMHQCPVCPKSFLTPYKLKRHHIIHTGQKPFICTLCGKAFTQSAHLKTHSQTVHHSRHPGDCLHDGIVPDNQQPACYKPAAGINTRDKRNYNITSAVPSSVASTWKEEFVTDNFIVPHSESGNSPKNMPNVSGDDSTTLTSISNCLDPVPQEQDVSASVDSSVNKVQNGYTCKVCLESFPSSLQLWIHSTVHSTPKQSESNRESLQTFSKKSTFTVNLQSRELNSSKSEIPLKHQCSKCLKLFCSPSKLQRHFLIHTGQKPYSCTICGKAYRQKIHLKSHLSISNKCSLSAGIVRKKQILCNRNQTSPFPTQSSLQQELIPGTPVNSSVELELQCKISVNTLQDLRKTEIKTDTVEEPHRSLKSSICFRLNEQEQQFMTRKGLKPFQCEICDRTYRLEVNLTRHRKIHRNQKELGKSPTPVQNSNSVNGSNSEVIKHLPELSRADPVALEVNVKTETQSDICTDYNGAFNKDADLITSTENQSEPYPAVNKQQRIPTIHQCHTCSKCFPSVSKLQRHMMIHTGLRPFGCAICGKSFRQKTHLRVHYRTHTWSKYHKQRSLYINRPPSGISWFNTKVATDVPVQQRMGQKMDYLRNSGVSSVKHLDLSILKMNAQTTDNRGPLLSHMSKKNAVVHMRKVSNVTVKRTRTVKSVHNPGNVQHKCFQCLKCFPSASKLQRHEMVHTGLKPFRCLICGKTFRQAPHLKTHERTHCKRKPPKSFHQQVNTRGLKLKNQQQLYPRITVRVPPQKKCVKTDSAFSHSEVVGNAGNIPLCSRPEVSVTEVNSFLNTNPKSTVTFKKRRPHICRICCKNFSSPYKLSRHLVTHSGRRPYRCILCRKTFTQKGHLKVHEHRCRQCDRISDCSKTDMYSINTNHLLEKGVEHLTHCTDFVVNATIEQRETQSVPVGYYSFPEKDLAIDTGWLEVPEVGLKEENNESEQKQTENSNQATDNYSYSFASELAFELNELLHNQNMAAPPLSHQHEGNAHHVEIPCEPIADSNKLLSDKFVSSVANNYLCEPLTVFESDRCTASFSSKNNLKQHVCSTAVQLEMTESVERYHCDICFKNFVSPSKLKRHYLVHTGQRPFRCDICGKTFTQSAHVRTHRRTH